ncbi:hypothetical protein, partial [Flaviflexus sp.]|uniref:hypothetical protein n=1 Tax=Flaviflexus sp. TaxID=1969482 RepID=UPI003F911129
ADRVAHDPAGEHVLDGAEVELALVDLNSSGPVLGDVGQPQLADVIGGEVPLHGIIVDWWPGSFPILGPLLPERDPPLVVPADLPRVPLAHHLAGIGGLATAFGRASDYVGIWAISLFIMILAVLINSVVSWLERRITGWVD